MRFELLSKRHRREDFDCGSPPLNLFLSATARQHIDRGISRTFVLVKEAAPAKIIGFFTLSATQISREGLPGKFAKRLPREAGMVRLARLAVGLPHQGKGLGLVLIYEALRMTAEASERIGVCGLIVDAKDNDAADFYRHFGFKQVESNPLGLFLPITTIRGVLEG